MEEKKKSKRIWEIDFLRGVLIIGMCFDHFMFFIGSLIPGIFRQNGTLPVWLNNVADFSWAYWTHPAKLAVRYVGLLLFFMLIGISSRFSRNNLKRGLLTFGFGVLLALILLIFSLITKINYYALFPIIACLGASMLIYYGIKNLFEKVFKVKLWKWWSLGLGVAIVIGAFIMNLCRSSIGIVPGRIFITMMGEYAPGPANSDTPLNPAEIFNVIIGASRWGNDWLGLIPYCGFTFIGGFIGEHFYAEKKSVFFRRNPEKNVSFNEKALQKTSFINWLGKKTLWVYILHPVILVPIVFIFYWIGTGRWPF